jgi:hypothetical protein
LGTSQVLLHMSTALIGPFVRALRRARRLDTRRSQMLLDVIVVRLLFALCSGLSIYRLS